ncbi:LysR substrate-binding domain-containing protein (plasmid) [Streptomyces sp. NBC_00984]|uniref:LysR substrate-binding domain-containing protein n=1 Tax=Streptomyces sp. NBC_00984 TaxID=2903700 RepID=UPI0038663028|nr:LysR substrate-binding domain-containing protein [Streptomyces sp. NBC_00984]
MRRTIRRETEKDRDYVCDYPAIVLRSKVPAGSVFALLGPNGTEHVTALVEDRVDVAFVRPSPNDERLVADVLTTEQRIVVVHERWPLADARMPGRPGSASRTSPSSRYSVSRGTARTRSPSICTSTTAPSAAAPGSPSPRRRR